MSALARAWDAFWFRPAPARRIALLRVVVGAFLFQAQWDHHFSYLNLDRAGADTFEGVGLASFLEGALGHEVWGVVLWLGLVLTAAFTLGLFHRVLAPLCALTLLFLFAYRNSWGQLYHHDNLPVLHLCVLALAPAAHAWSMDAWLRRRLGSRRWFSWLAWPALPEGPAQPGGTEGRWEFGWGIKLMSAVTMLAYWLAGVAKVEGPLGWSWAFGTNLRDQIAYDALYKSLISPGTEGAWVSAIYPHPEYLVPAAAFALGLELFAPLGLFHKRLGQLMCLGLFGMHWGIDLLMTITFPYPAYGLAYLSFFAVEKPVDWVLGRLGLSGARVTEGSPS